MKTRKSILNFVHDAGAATAIEYGLMSAMLAVALIVAWTGLGSQMSTVLTEVSAAAK
jgi:pilus assembly protein Flp/PilA